MAIIICVDSSASTIARTSCLSLCASIIQTAEEFIFRRVTRQPLNSCKSHFILKTIILLNISYSRESPSLPFSKAGNSNDCS